MNSINKSLLASTAIVVISHIGHTVYNVLFFSPNIETYLEAQGYTPLFNAKINNFSKWKRNYQLWKHELVKHIPELNKEKDDNGGFILKQWCRINLNKEFTGRNYSYFDLTKRYCTLNIQNAILEEEGVRTIDEVDESKRGVFGDNYQRLLPLCQDRFRLAHIPNNKKIFEQTKRECSTKNWL